MIHIPFAELFRIMDMALLCVCAALSVVLKCHLVSLLADKYNFMPPFHYSNRMIHGQKGTTRDSQRQIECCYQLNTFPL